MGYSMKYVIGAGCALFLGATVYFFQAADANVKAGIVSVAGLLFAAILTNYHAREREVRARHFREKRDAYETIFDLIVDIFQSVKSERSLSEDDMHTRMLDFKKGLMIWGSASTIRLWNRVETEISPDSPNDTAALMENLFRAIREDLGHDDSSLPFGELTSLFVIPEDKKKIWESYR